jgi:ferredoxin
MKRGLYIGQEKCIGCGLCAEIAPRVFTLNDEGVYEIIDPTGDEESKIQEAINECPVECLEWEEK